MPRPKPLPHPIETYLATTCALRPLSIVNYVSVVRRIEREAGGDAEAWLQDKLRENTPKRTLTVWRCAVNYYLNWKNVEWVGVKPSLRKQPEGKNRQGLESEQVQAYNAEAERQPEPYRTILLLLPRTGLRCFEVCALTLNSYDPRDGVLKITGKRGSYREVPVTKVARRILDTFIEHYPRNPDGLLFWTMPEKEGRLGRARPVTTRDVRAATFKIAQEHRDVLWDLSPHMLRHTVATTLMEEGVPLKMIQSILGHKSARSLDPYLHPSKKSLRDAMEKLS